MSVVIPTRNRAEQLQCCLDGLAVQSAGDSAFEVVVVVDGSNDDTTARLEERRDPFPLRFQVQDRKGPCVARNRGAALAAGDVLLFLDDDVVPSPGCVEAHLALHKDVGNAVGIGRIDPNPGSSPDWFALEFAGSWRRHFDRLSAKDGNLGWKDCFGGNLSLTASLFHAVDGFSTESGLCRDVELGYRLATHDAQFRYAADGSCVHHDTRRAEALLDAVEKQGSSAVALRDRHPKMHSALLGAFHDTAWPEMRCRRFLVEHPRLLIALSSARPFRGSTRQRWYRFLYRTRFWLGVRQAMGRERWTRFACGTPILMYHAFSVRNADNSRFVVDAGQFERHLRWLGRNGYRSISLDDYADYRRRNEEPPAKSFILTIDDGYRDNAEIAAPLLRKFAVRATFFPVSGLLGGKNEWSESGPLKGRPLLSAAEVRTLSSDEYFSIGAHSRTHPHLVELEADVRRFEIEGSIRELSEVTGRQTVLFAYPYGEFDAVDTESVRMSGACLACGVEPGLNSAGTPIFELRRIEVRGTDSVFQFARKVRIGKGRYLPRRRKKPV